MVLFIYSGVIYNERESIECLQRLLNDLGITIETTADGEEVYVVKPAGNHVLAKPESKPKEHIKFNIDQPVMSGLYFSVLLNSLLFAMFRFLYLYS